MNTTIPGLDKAQTGQPQGASKTVDDKLAPNDPLMGMFAGMFQSLLGQATPTMQPGTPVAGKSVAVPPKGQMTPLVGAANLQAVGTAMLKRTVQSSSAVGVPKILTARAAQQPAEVPQVTGHASGASETAFEPTLVSKQAKLPSAEVQPKTLGPTLNDPLRTDVSETREAISAVDVKGKALPIQPSARGTILPAGHPEAIRQATPATASVTDDATQTSGSHPTVKAGIPTLSPSTGGIASTEPTATVTVTAMVAMQTGFVKPNGVSKSPTPDQKQPVLPVVKPVESAPSGNSGSAGISVQMPWLSQPAHQPVQATSNLQTPNATQTLSMSHPNPGQALNNIVIQQVQTGQGEVKVQIHPEGLGNIVISVTKTDGGLQLQMVANQMSTMQWLTQQSNQIADAVRNSGADVSGVQVSFGRADMGNSSNGQSPKRQKQDSPWGRTSTVVAAGSNGGWTHTQEYLDLRNSGISIQV